MKRIAAILVFVPFVAAAEGYLPQPCVELDHPPPAAFQCPSPYVEMVSNGTDSVFERAWHCRETGHTLGLASGGCGGGHGLGMFPDWSVPDAAAADNSSPDIRAEVIQWAFRPCAEMKYDNDPSMKHSGISRDDFVELAMAIMPTDAIDETVKQIEELNLKEFSHRKMFYGVVLGACSGKSK